MESTNGEPVTLTFITYFLQSYHNTDWVEISNGSTTQSYYYSNSIPSPVTGNSITVKFISGNYAITDSRFHGFLAVVCCSVDITTDVTGEFCSRIGSFACCILTYQGRLCHMFANLTCILSIVLSTVMSECCICLFSSYNDTDIQYFFMMIVIFPLTCIVQELE